MEELKVLLIHSSEFDAAPPEAGAAFQLAGGVVALCQDLDILRPDEIIDATMASRKELALFHDPAYLTNIEETDQASPSLLRLAKLRAGGSLLGAKLLTEGKAKAVFFPAGGDIHARPDRPSDDTPFNDTALALTFLASLGLRAAFINLSARHADGVQDAFYERSDVLTVSVHEASRDAIPNSGFVGEDGLGKGKGSALNVPLPEGSYDEIVIDLISDLVVPFVRRKQPDVIVAVLSADILAADGSSLLGMTNNVLLETTRALLRLHRPLLVLGGNARNAENAARAWSLVWAALTGRVSLADSKGTGGLSDRPVFIPPERHLSVGRDLKPVLEILRQRLYGTRLPTRKDLKALEELDEE